MAEVGFNMGKQLAILTYCRPDLHQVVAGQSTWRSAAHGTNLLICLPPWSFYRLEMQMSNATEPS